MLRDEAYTEYLMVKEASSKPSFDKERQAGAIGALAVGGSMLGKRIGERKASRMAEGRAFFTGDMKQKNPELYKKFVRKEYDKLYDAMKSRGDSLKGQYNKMLTTAERNADSAIKELIRKNVKADKLKGRMLGGGLGAVAGLGTGLALTTAYNRYKRSKK